MDLYDPRIISSEPFQPHDYDDLIAQKAILPSEQGKERYATIVERYKHLTDVTVHRIIYQSDDCRVTGIAALPAEINQDKYPILIFNRGGTAEFGKLNVRVIMRYMVHFARRGFLVFASNFRGADGGDGAWDYGGTQIRDMEELHAIAQNHPAWDGRNIFMYGGSWGGALTLLAIKHGLDLNAAVSASAPSDLAVIAAQRPEMERLYMRHFPQWQDQRQRIVEELSPLCWPEKLARVPLLILHGGDDDRVDVSHYHALKEKLEAASVPFKGVLYPGDDHFFSQNREAEAMEVEEWFKAYKV